MQKRTVLFVRHAIPVLITFVLVFGVFTGAQAGVDFKGKAIVFLVPSSPGGGTDIFGRFIANNIKRHLPGEPNIVVRNMPAAGGLTGTNTVYRSRPNGRTALVSTAKVVMANVLRPKGTEFWMEKMQPIYASPIGLVYYSAAGLIKEPKDIMNVKGLIFGHGAPTAATSGCFIWGQELLGFKTEKAIFGYGGSGDTRLAFHSGEINCSGGSTLDYNVVIKSLVKKGEVTPLFQSGVIDENGNVVREESAPDVPTVPELYEQIYGKKPSGPVFDVVKLIVGVRTFGKGIILPPTTPPEIVDTYRDAVAKMVKDPKFLKDAAKLNPGAPHFSGKKLELAYPGGVTADPKVIEFMKEKLNAKYGVIFE